MTTLIVAGSYAHFREYCHQTKTNPTSVIYVGPDHEGVLYGLHAENMEIIMVCSPALIPGRMLNVIEQLVKLGARYKPYT